MAEKEVLYQPIIKFASKDRVKSLVMVPFVRHRTATFPKTFKTMSGATQYARRQIKPEEGVWQLPGAKKVRK